MHPLTANEDFRLSFWARVREFAVPPSMIESATARRVVGDWAGACAAARVDVDLDLRAAGRAHGGQLVAQVRADLRHLAPDLLRWHFPRIGPNGLLRPGLTVSLARYGPAATGGGAIHLVVRTPPAWAGGGQRISLALWAPSEPGAGLHPHPRPDRRYRLDLHRHLWDVRRAGELLKRSGRWPSHGNAAHAGIPVGVDACAVDRWAAEAALLLSAEASPGNVVAVRLTRRHRVLLNLGPPDEAVGGRAVPVLPDAATWVLPDLRLLHAGLVDVERLHPLVASALRPGGRPAGAERRPSGSEPRRLVECRGATHRIAVVNGVLAPLDHDPGEIRREELLGALGGPEVPCLQAIDEAHRHPENLEEVRARLDHGDTAGACAAVETLLGPDVLVRGGALRDELETAARRQVLHGLYRTGLAGCGPLPSTKDKRRRVRRRPRHANVH
ncbi:hypothetical protein [Amycolatopsis sp. Hca4]|uniref:hypothetical protein n=1 Tax=Amycolatopsis sp. Hca4 TaxID=2742131 RepID=UPI001591BB0E|nr:hypothetical protein [Amycolatopsis sp. Hca4]QKV80381.1 hypothetical protein HUT10_46300 [Amycolatopsis sp. Hca4]